MIDRIRSYRTAACAEHGFSDDVSAKTKDGVGKKRCSDNVGNDQNCRHVPLMTPEFLQGRCLGLVADAMIIITPPN